MDNVEVVRQWYSEHEFLINKRHEEEFERMKFEEDAKNRKMLDAAEKSSRLRGAVVKVVSAVKINRIIQRKTINSLKATPAVDALTRGARNQGFFESDAKNDDVKSRQKMRRGAVDASVFAPSKLLEMQNSPKSAVRRVSTTLGDPVRRRSIVLAKDNIDLNEDKNIIIEEDDDDPDEEEVRSASTTHQ